MMRVLCVFLALVLAACAGSQGPAPKVVNVRVGGTPLVLAAPDALCVDANSLRNNSAGVFAILDDCAALGPVARGVVQPANNGLITVSVSAGPIARGGESPQTGLETLRDFLSGPGLPALARSGEPKGVKIESTSIEDDILLLQIHDPGPSGVPRLSRYYWRGYKEVKGQTVSAALSTFSERGEQARSRAVVKSVLSQIDAANPTARAQPSPPPLLEDTADQVVENQTEETSG